jgi:hypothetical protein
LVCPSSGKRSPPLERMAACMPPVLMATGRQEPGRNPTGALLQAPRLSTSRGAALRWPGRVVAPKRDESRPPSGVEDGRLRVRSGPAGRPEASHAALGLPLSDAVVAGAADGVVAVDVHLGVAGVDLGAAQVASLALDLAQESAVAVAVVLAGVGEEHHGGSDGRECGHALGGEDGPALAATVLLGGVDAEDADVAAADAADADLEGVAVGDLDDVADAALDRAGAALVAAAGVATIVGRRRGGAPSPASGVRAAGAGVGLAGDPCVAQSLVVSMPSRLDSSRWSRMSSSTTTSWGTSMTRSGNVGILAFEHTPADVADSVGGRSAGAPAARVPLRLGCLCPSHFITWR